MAEGVEIIDARADQTSIAPAGSHSGLARIVSPVEMELQRVERLLREVLSPREPWLSGLYAGLGRLGGKRIRPLLCLLFGQASGETTAAHIQIAAAYELVHLATLVHDDVLDEADLRRGVPALHREQGTRNAILCGDSLFTLAFSVASRTGHAGVIGELAGSSHRVCSGEIRQNFSAGDWSLSLSGYEQIISAKTASLCAGAARCGVWLNGGEAGLMDAAWDFGNQIGIAFQVIDDCLDLVGSREVVGKTLGTDLVGGKLTYPLIHCLSLKPELLSDLAACRGAPDDPAVLRVIAAIESTGSLAAARAFADKRIGMACSLLDRFPESAARQSLLALARFVAERNL